MALDRLCALIEPAMTEARRSDARPALARLRTELKAYTETPSGVGLDVPAWLLRLQNELERIQTTQSDLGNLAETIFHVPKVAVPSRNVTEPVGVPAPGVIGSTIAVNVTDSPNADGFSDEETDELVSAALTVWLPERLPELLLKLSSPE